jgi:hypothetical protein
VTLEVSYDSEFEISRLANTILDVGQLTVRRITRNQDFNLVRIGEADANPFDAVGVQPLGQKLNQPIGLVLFRPSEIIG